MRDCLAIMAAWLANTVKRETTSLKRKFADIGIHVFEVEYNDMPTLSRGTLTSAEKPVPSHKGQEEPTTSLTKY